MMQDDFFSNLPPENIIDILSRLPVKYILRCKSVCKSWIDLIESPEFPKLHLSRSAPGLVVCLGKDREHPCKIVELVDDLDLKNSSCYYNLLFSFGFGFASHLYLHNSVDGLLFTTQGRSISTVALYICNPITREYFELPSLPQEFESIERSTFGFGVSKTTGQYKVVMIFLNASAVVYSLGTRSCRRVVVDNPHNYLGNVAAFLNGNLHWLASDFPLISCFDLETELFSTFSSPSNNSQDLFSLSTLRDCLCLCDPSEDENVFWLMKKYDDEKSWTKEYIIKIPPGRELCYDYFPVKVFEDGDILIASRHGLGQICYSKKTGTIDESYPFGSYNYGQSWASYTPSFLSLKRFTMEIVCTF